MKKRHVILWLILTLLALLILLPLLLTAVYSFCAPTEIKAFMQTRNQYGTVLMELKLRPDLFSLDQYWRVLIQDTSILRYYFNSVGYTLTTMLPDRMMLIQHYSEKGHLLAEERFENIFAADDKEDHHEGTDC